MARKREGKCKELIRGETSQMLYPYPEYEKIFLVVILDTTAGDITLEMHMDESPRTCHSFLEHCRNGYFEPCLFNRIQKVSLASNCWSALRTYSVEYPFWIGNVTTSEVWYMLLLQSAIKSIAVAVLLQILFQSLPLIVVHLQFCIQLYLFVTIVLEILAAIANTVFGITIEPHFDNPFAAVSLEEFWVRWRNLLVSNCQRETVFNPVLSLLQRVETEGNHRVRATVLPTGGGVG